MTTHENVLETVRHVSEYYLPRILTQICRDERSPSYGCADRNWWHYKIRDFPSIILQQAALAVFEAGNNSIIDAQYASKIARACLSFWATRASAFGSFEEYYPWESGYPPLAFSSLAVFKLLSEGIADTARFHDLANTCAKQLLSRFESQAGNQQVAGLAALAFIRKIYPDLVSNSQFAQLKYETLSLQQQEGWFIEYGGPDLGYLSVTLDCLWDLYDVTSDDDYLVSASRALKYTARIVCNWGSSLGAHNSRNTDYIVPYGLTRFLTSDTSEYRSLARGVLGIILERATSPSHHLYSVDDRYLCHYIGASFMRALTTLSNHTSDEVFSNPANSFNGRLLTKHHVLHDLGKYKILLTPSKGGIISIRSPHSSFTDFGWTAYSGEKLFVTNFWSSDWTLEPSTPATLPYTYTIKGSLFQHSYILPNPASHFILRISSFLLGHRLIKFLKNALIFKNKRTPLSFHRTIQLYSDYVVVSDKINATFANISILSAPRSSVRHVSSADCYHQEDHLTALYSSRKTYQEHRSTTVVTTYNLTLSQQK